MDPNETLKIILRNVATLLDRDLTHEEVVDAAMDLAEAVRDLDEWIKLGGFLPGAWVVARV